jgi:hypothetical protein
MWIVLAAILISAAASAEKAATGPDSNYETGLMSYILIGLTAVPAFLTAFWGAHGCWASCGKKEKNSAGMAPEISVGGPTQGGQQVHQVVLLP